MITYDVEEDELEQHPDLVQKDGITREPIGANLADEFLESENIRRMFCHYRPQPRKADLERFREQLQLPSENNKRPENNVVERVGLIVTAN
ncbi:hypothetical protein TNCV_2024531 [Trichonephila clavipes]|nr:hypothetical protein TNCV_2024531 [Trichonephila clavipes]